MTELLRWLAEGKKQRSGCAVSGRGTAAMAVAEASGARVFSGWRGLRLGGKLGHWRLLK
jgi:hypothetical protein